MGGLTSFTVEHLSHWFEKNHVLIKDCSLALKGGDVLRLRGSNGSGKTTLLRLFATVLESREGRIRLNDFDYSQPTPSLRALIGYGPGTINSFYEELTGLENLEFFYSLKKPKAEFAENQCRALAERLSLAAELSKQVRFYSTGMRQKLGIIRALAVNPSLLLLDEPTSSLDDASSKQVISLLTELSQKRESIIILASPKDETWGIETRYLDLGARPC